MPVNKKTSIGTVKISEKAIANLAGLSINECYGIVDVTSQNIKSNLKDLLNIKDFKKGIEVEYKNGSLIIDCYVVVAYGVKVSEVVIEAQKRVKYSVEKALNIDVTSTNIHVEGISN